MTMYCVHPASRRHSNFWLAVALLLASGLATAGCNKTPLGVTILVGGDTQGWITPCGCAANQSGGLARRAALVSAGQSNTNVMLLDVGGAASGTSEYQRLKFESVLRGLNQMGLNAMNIGASETALGPEDLMEIGTRCGIKWVSCNLFDHQQQPCAESLATFQLGGLSIAVTGVVDPELVEHPGWSVADAVPMLLKAFADCQADVKIVLAYFDEPGLRNLAQSLPEVDYVIGGPTGQAVSPLQIGSVQVLSATNKGKFLAEIALVRSADGFRQQSAGIVEVSSSLPEDSLQIANLNDYNARLTQRDFTALQAGLVEPIAAADADYAIAGSNSCRSCHAHADETWHNSKHAHAWEVLVHKGASYDPNCQQCHATGYGLPGGFSSVSSTFSRVHVGCESCHGPSQGHVLNPAKRTPFLAREQCVKCHDRENSPEFAWEPYWARIRHGKLAEEET